ncbi:MAG: glycoside hydrolase, partial [Micromonosporaceae bacterium]|nr:glycoside hydrolase [Micromonosporaceae bacterium]
GATGEPAAVAGRRLSAELTRRLRLAREAAQAPADPGPTDPAPADPPPAGPGPASTGPIDPEPVGSP